MTQTVLIPVIRAHYEWLAVPICKGPILRRKLVFSCCQRWRITRAGANIELGHDDLYLLRRPWEGMVCAGDFIVSVTLFHRSSTTAAGAASTTRLVTGYKIVTTNYYTLLVNLIFHAIATRVRSFFAQEGVLHRMLPISVLTFPFPFHIFHLQTHLQSVQCSETETGELFCGNNPFWTKFISTLLQINEYLHRSPESTCSLDIAFPAIMRQLLIWWCNSIIILS